MPLERYSSLIRHYCLPTRSEKDAECPVSRRSTETFGQDNERQSRCERHRAHEYGRQGSLRRRRHR